MALRYPPLTKFSRAVLKFLMCQPLPGRPTSVEAEERKLRWRSKAPSFVVALVFAVAAAYWKLQG